MPKLDLSHYQTGRASAACHEEPSDDAVSSVIDRAEAEFDLYSGKSVLVRTVEAHYITWDISDYTFDPPLPCTVRELEIVDEDWGYEGLYPCWVVTPQESRSELETMEDRGQKLYVFGSLIKYDGTRSGAGGWIEMEGGKER